MSYIEDIQGRYVNNPINETNSVYTRFDNNITPSSHIEYEKADEKNNKYYYPKSSYIDYDYKSSDKHTKVVTGTITEESSEYYGLYEYDHMIMDTSAIQDTSKYFQTIYNHNEPVSDIDTQYYSEYRTTVEDLRKKTESYNEKLEACLVPKIIDGMAFQPFEPYYHTFESDDIDEDNLPTKTKSETYQFSDDTFTINNRSFLFRTNKVKFIDDRHRRMIYNDTIHFMTLKEDEENGVKLVDVLKRMFYDNDKCTMIGINGAYYFSSVDKLLSDILELNNKYKDGTLDSKTSIEFTDDTKTVAKSGQIIDTGFPSSLYNLHTLGWIYPSLISINGLFIPWYFTIIHVDNIDTFVSIDFSGISVFNTIFKELYLELSYFVKKDIDLEMDYIHIPFRCEYVPYFTAVTDMDNAHKYCIRDNKVDAVYSFHTSNGGMIFKDSEEAVWNLCSKTSAMNKNILSIGVDRIISADPALIWTEFSMNNDPEVGNSNESILLSKIGMSFNRRFKDFSDYRMKLKQFNFMGFEYTNFKEYNPETEEETSNNAISLADYGYNVTWHPFNIMDIQFDKLFGNDKYFKVCYNKHILYDQDNILRIKGFRDGTLISEYEQYLKDLKGNIQTYIDEIYKLARKDIGEYLVSVLNSNDGSTVSIKYYSPYETFKIYNEKNSNSLSFEDYMNNGIYNITNAQKYGVFADEDMTEQFTFSINTQNDPYENFEGDNRGMIIPSYDSTIYNIVQADEEQLYDRLKIRFQLSYLNNMEEGSTPVDEFIYYYSHITYSNREQPISDEQDAFHYLNLLAQEIFKHDPNEIYSTIRNLNHQSKWYVDPDKKYASGERDKNAWMTGESNNVYYNYAYKISEEYINNKPQSEWALRLNLPEMFIYKLDESDYSMSASSMNILDTVFDFTYDPEKTYAQNVSGNADGKSGLEDTRGVNYIIGYDSDKLEAAIKRSIVSMSRTGKELKALKTSGDNYFETKFTVDKLKTVYVYSGGTEYIRECNSITTDIKVNYIKDNILTLEKSVGDSYNFLQETNTTFTYSYDNTDMVTIHNNTVTIVNLSSQISVTYDSVVYTSSEGLHDGYVYLYNGDTLVAKIPYDIFDNYSGITMSRWHLCKDGNPGNNFVIIFDTDGKLISTYNTIEYNTYQFRVDLPVSVSALNDDDIFEFVFFLNANNNTQEKEGQTEDDFTIEIPKTYVSNYINYKTPKNKAKGMTDNDKDGDVISKEKSIVCNTSLIEPENLIVLVNVMPISGTPDIELDKVTQQLEYELNYTLYSYLWEANTSTDNSIIYEGTLTKDPMINGLHRITKQGGGEYIVTFDGTIPDYDNESTSSEGGSSDITYDEGVTAVRGLGLNVFSGDIHTINYPGTVDEFVAISKTNPWINSTLPNCDKSDGKRIVHCSDGNYILTYYEYISE